MGVSLQKKFGIGIVVGCNAFCTSSGENIWLVGEIKFLVRDVFNVKNGQYNKDSWYFMVFCRGGFSVFVGFALFKIRST